MAKTFVVDAAALADQLEECEPGEELVLNITVNAVKGDQIKATATGLEYAEAEEEMEEEEPAEPPEPAMKHGPQGKRMPRALEKKYGD